MPKLLNGVFVKTSGSRSIKRLMRKLVNPKVDPNVIAQKLHGKANSQPIIDMITGGLGTRSADVFAARVARGLNPAPGVTGVGKYQKYFYTTPERRVISTVSPELKYATNPAVKLDADDLSTIRRGLKRGFKDGAEGFVGKVGPGHSKGMWYGREFEDKLV